MQTRTNGAGSAPGGAGAGPLRKLLVRDGRSLRLLATEDVTWIGAAGNYARVHANGRVHRIRTPLSALERRLDPDRFARIHRSAVVNLDRVAAIAPWSYGDYLVTTLKLSRHYRRELEMRFGVEP